MAPRRAAARTNDSGSEESEAIVVAPKTKNKENRIPAASFSLTASNTKGAGTKNAVETSGEEEEDALVNKSTKASASKKQAAGGAARGAARASNKAPGGGKRGGKKAVEVEEEEDGDDDDETTGDEVIQETQEDEMEMEVDASNKGRGKKRAAPAEKGKGPATTKGHNASGVKEDDEETAVTPREKRLQAKLDSISTALTRAQTAFEQLRELRETGAEKSEKELTDIAAGRAANSIKTIQSYKSENESLRAEVADLSARLSSRTGANSPVKPQVAVPSSASTTPADKVALRAALEDVRNLQKELEEHDAATRQKLESRDQEWKRELAKTIKAKDEEAKKDKAALEAEAATAAQELEAEIQHSKSLQAKFKSSGSNGLSVSSSTSTSTSSAVFQKLQTEFQDLKMRLNLNEDLTGLVVHSIKYNDDSSSVYNCVLNDCRGKAGALIFKISFLADDTVYYEPDVVPERDPVLCEILPEDFQSGMRFKAEKTGLWFLNLFKAVNKVRE